MSQVLNSPQSDSPLKARRLTSSATPQSPGSATKVGPLPESALEAQRPIGSPTSQSPGSATEVAEGDAGDSQTSSSTHGSKEKDEKSKTKMQAKIKPVPDRLFPSTWWGLEITSTILSLVAFTGLILILGHCDGHPQEDWLYNHLTLNGLVALLSTITRATLLVPVTSAVSQGKWVRFCPTRQKPTKGQRLSDLGIIDEASRGAWGSLLLLWKMRGHHLVTVGAVLIVLLLAFDTFSQQILQIKFRSVISTSPDATGAFNRSESYLLTPKVEQNLTGVPDIDYSMKAGTFNALFGSKIADLPIYCPTGNCTWPIIPTLGMCGGCTNVTDRLTTVCGEDDDGTECNSTLPSGTTFSYYDFRNLTIGYGGNYFVLNMTSGNVYSTFDPISTSGSGGVSDVPLYAVNFEAIMNGGVTPADSAGPAAVECALWLCVQAYNVSVQSGLQTQRLLRSWSKVDYSASPGSLINFTEIPAEFNVAPGSVYQSSTQSLPALRASFNFSSSVSGFPVIPGGLTQYNDDIAIASYYDTSYIFDLRSWFLFSSSSERLDSSREHVARHGQ